MHAGVAVDVVDQGRVERLLPGQQRCNRSPESPSAPGHAIHARRGHLGAKRSQLVFSVGSCASSYGGGGFGRCRSCWTAPSSAVSASL